MVIEEEEGMSGFEKSKLPYSLLLDPVLDRAAAYTNTHRLITENASADLIQFARENQAKQMPWDDSLHDPQSPWRPLPKWASEEIRARCVLVWIKRGSAPESYWRSMPSA